MTTGYFLVSNEIVASSILKNFDIPATLRHHFDSAKSALLHIPYWVWPLPFVMCLAIFLVSQSPIGWITQKSVQEIVAPTIIGMTAVLTIFVHYWTRELFTLMLACLVWALFLRELHFVGTSRMIYITVIVLAIIASHKRDELSKFLQQRAIGTLLPLAMWTYVISKLFDRHLFSSLPNYVLWHDHVEETLESSGHVITFALVIVTLRFASLHLRKSAGSGQKTAS